MRRRRDRGAAVVRATLYLGGRRALEYWLDARGTFYRRWHCDPGRVCGADREFAAWAANEFLPRLTHDEVYAALFG